MRATTRGSGAGDGAVKFFNSGRGYGFITPDGGGKDLFVHFSAIVNEGFKTLDNGARVAYQVREGRNGARSVRRPRRRLTARECPPGTDPGGHSPSLVSCSTTGI